MGLIWVAHFSGGTLPYTFDVHKGSHSCTRLDGDRHPFDHEHIYRSDCSPHQHHHHTSCRLVVASAAAPQALQEEQSSASLLPSAPMWNPSPPGSPVAPLRCASRPLSSLPAGHASHLSVMADRVARDMRLAHNNILAPVNIAALQQQQQRRNNNNSGGRGRP